MIKIGKYCEKNAHGPNGSIIKGPRLKLIKLYKGIRFMYYNRKGTCWRLDVER